MKTFQKVFTALALVAVVGLIGCAKPEDKPTKSETDDKSKANQAETPTADDSGATPADDSAAKSGDETSKTEPNKVEPTSPSNDTPDPVEPQAGSGENKGGKELPPE